MHKRKHNDTHAHPTLLPSHIHTLKAATADDPDALKVEDNFDLSDALLLEVKRAGFVFFAARTAALPYKCEVKKKKEGVNDGVG